MNWVMAFFGYVNLGLIALYGIGLLAKLVHRVRRYNEGRNMLYYSNGGPGPATKLYRVNAPANADIAAWRQSPADSWQPKTGWRPNTMAQLDILGTGDFFMIDASEVKETQDAMSAEVAKYQSS